MSDYFRFYCDGLDEPRLLYAMHQCTHVPLVWLWILCECARTKKNQITQPSNSMLVGLQHKLNVPPGSIQVALKLLVEIEYIEDRDGLYIVRKWNDLQSKYMQEKAWKESHKNQKKPKETKNPIGEERRGEESREENKDKPASKSPDTWMTEFGVIWKARFGGELPFRKFARPLARVVRDYGNEKALAGFTRYCRDTPAEYANAESFAQKAGVWISGDNGGSNGSQADKRRIEQRSKEYAEPGTIKPLT